MQLAEFRGPGVHHNFDDSDSGYDVDLENKGKPFGIGGYKGRIIFLGDGTEVLTDSDDTEMFDNAEEDKDLESQVSKATSTTSKDSNAEESAAKKPEEESKTVVEKPKEESKPAAAPAASTEAQTTESKEK